MKKILILLLMVLVIALTFSIAFFGILEPTEAYAVPSDVIFDSGWKGTIGEYSTLTKITFATSAPAGYSADGRRISSVIMVYVNDNKSTDIAFVYGNIIYAPNDSSRLFENCNNVANIEFFNFDTRYMTNTFYMFFACTSLQSLNLSNFNTSNVTNMGYMFYNCGVLTNLDLSSFNTSQVTDMNNMFAYSSNLTNITFGNNFHTGNVVYMEYMFYTCASLTVLDLESFNTGNVINMKYMFAICAALVNLDLTNFNTSNVEDMSYMFYGCGNLISLDISSNFNTSNVVNMDSMFYSCVSLENIDLSYFNTSNVENMSSMFYGCAYLTDLDLSGFDTSRLTNMSFMFANCFSLTVLDLSNFDLSECTNVNHMFLFTANIKIVYAPYNLNATIMLPGTFYGNNQNIDEINSQNCSTIDGGVVSVSAFYKVYNITLYENGGTFISGYTKPSSYVYQTGLTLPESSNITRNTYKFLGWTLSDEETDTDYITEISQSDSHNKTLYAKWQLKDEITINEDAQNFVYDGDNISFEIVGNDLSDFIVMYYVEGNWSETAPINAGSYNVKVLRDEDEDYLAFEKIINNALVIGKANYLNITHADLTGTYNQAKTLSDYILENNFIWITDTTIPTVNVTSYSAMYNADSINYNNFYLNIVLILDKATYDLSGVTFADKTVKADGNMHSIVIDGTLPSGLTVQYEGNNKQNAGLYTITAIFTGDSSNYNNVNNMTASLKLLIPEFSEKTEGNNTEVPDVVILSDEGFEVDIEMVVSIIPNANITHDFGKNSKVAKAYSVQLVRGEEVVALDNNVTVKLLIPIEISDKDFRIYSGQNQITYTIIDGYAVFDIDSLSDLTFVYEENKGFLLWLIILITILLVAIALVANKIIKDKKNKKI